MTLDTVWVGMVLTHWIKVHFGSFQSAASFSPRYGKRPYFSTFVVVAPFPFHEFLCPLNSFSCFNAFVKFDYPSFLTDSCEKLYPPKTFSSFRVSSGKNNISGVLGEWGTL